MNILLLGSGGREHALAWKIAQSEKLDRLFVAPGNPGMAEIATCVALDPMKFPEVGRFVVENKIDMVVVSATRRRHCRLFSQSAGVAARCPYRAECRRRTLGRF